MKNKTIINSLLKKLIFSNYNHKNYHNIKHIQGTRLMLKLHMRCNFVFLMKNIKLIIFTRKHRLLHNATSFLNEN
jgi:hypothetical protein